MTSTSYLKLYEVDVLVELKNIWGNGILTSRELAYFLVSGSERYGDIKKYRNVLKSYYRKYPEFARYIDSNIDLVRRNTKFLKCVMLPVLNILNGHLEGILKEAKAQGGSLLMVNEFYCYIAFKKDIDFAIEGARLISDV